MNKPIIPMLMSGNLTAKLSGVSRSALARVKHFHESGLYEPLILVHSFHAAFDKEITILRNSGHIPMGLVVRNLFSDLEQAANQSELNLPSSVFHYANYKGVKDPENPNVERFYKDGEYVAYANWGDGSFVPVVNLLSRGQKFQTIWLRDDHSIALSRSFDANGRVLEDSYRTRSGEVYLRVIFTDGEPSLYLVKTSEGSEVAFRTKDELISYWLVHFCSDFLQDNVLISEWTYQIDAVQMAKEVLHFKDIYVFHGSHILTKNPRYRDEIVPFYQKTIQKVPEMAACVVLTDEQLFDLRKRDPSLRNIHVVPHVMSFEASEAMRSTREQGLVVSVCQLREIKGIAQFVPFFKRILEKTQGVKPKFEIYGVGPDFESTKRAIRTHGLQDSVFLKGYTGDSGAVYRNAQVAVFPSQREGQLLSLFEAIANGCVPVAFDFKYGARAGIVDGRNGFIVDLDNYEELADAVALLLSDDQLRNEMSKECLTKAGTYTPSDFIDRWTKVFSAIGIL